MVDSLQFVYLEIRVYHFISGQKQLIALNSSCFKFFTLTTQAILITIALIFMYRNAACISAAG